MEKIINYLAKMRTFYFSSREVLIGSFSGQIDYILTWLKFSLPWSSLRISRIGFATYLTSRPLLRPYCRTWSTYFPVVTSSFPADSSCVLVWFIFNYLPFEWSLLCLNFPRSSVSGLFPSVTPWFELKMEAKCRLICCSIMPMKL